MNKLAHLSLRAKLTTILFLSSCIVVLLTFSLMAALYLGRVNSEIDKRLVQHGSSVAEQIDELQGKAESQINTIEDNSRIQSLINQPGLCAGNNPTQKYTAQQSEFTQALQQIASTDNVDFVYVTNAAGQLVGTYPDAGLACQPPNKALGTQTAATITAAQHGAISGDKVYARNSLTGKFEFRVVASLPVQTDSDHATLGAVTAGYRLDGNALQAYTADTDTGDIRIIDGVSLYSFPSDLNKSCRSDVIATTLYTSPGKAFNQPLTTCAQQRRVAAVNSFIITSNISGSTYKTSYTPLVNEAGDTIGAIAYSLNVDYAQISNLNILLLVTGIIALVLIGVFFLIFFVVQNVTRMVDQLVDASKRVAAGDFTPRVAVVDDDEIGTLSRTFNIMTVQLSEYYGQLEGKVQQRTEQLRAAQTKELQRAAEVNRLKDEFVYIAVHELRAPVTAIKGYMYLVLQKKIGNPSKELADLLVHVEDAGKHLSSLIDDLIEIARAEAGQTEVHLAAQNLTEIVEKVVQEQQGSAEQKGLKLTYQSSQGLPYVLGDHDKLAEVFTNLVSNAIKYTLEGTVTVAHELQDDRILTRVSDTGVGISRDDQTHLFEKFFRAKNDKTAGVVGTGLGLFIVKLLVEKMGGKIGVESELGKGTTVIVSMQMTHQKPVASANTSGFKLAGLSSAAAPAPEPSAPAASPKSVPINSSQAAPPTPSAAPPVRLPQPDFSLARKSEPARSGALDGIKKKFVDNARTLDDQVKSVEEGTTSAFGTPLDKDGDAKHPETPEPDQTTPNTNSM